MCNNKDRVQEKIDTLRIVLEDLASANDTLIHYLKDEELNFTATTCLDYIASARREIKSEIASLERVI